MNYIITGPNSQNGGVASFVKNIAQVLDDVIVFRRGSESKSKSLILRIYDSIFLPNKFGLLCKRQGKPNVLINSSLSLASMIRDGLLVRKSKALGCKTILFIHGFREEALKHNWLLKWGYFKADHIVVLAEDFKRKLELHGYGKGITISLNPIEKALYQQTTSNDFTNNNGILFMARIERSKGIFEAIDSFKILKERHPELSFNVAGDGSARSEVEEYVKKNNIQDVVFHGFVNGEEKSKLLNGNMALMLLSYSEGLPICVLEAMAAGELILSRPVGGLKDLHKKCKFGVMDESHSPQFFADAFERYYTDAELMEQTRKNNQEFAKTHFHPSIIASNIQKIFREI